MKKRSSTEIAMTGTVLRYSVSGIGPNSGELVFAIRESRTGKIEVFTANVGGSYLGKGHLPEVFTAYVNTIGIAYVNNMEIDVKAERFDPAEAPRVSGISTR